MKILLTGASGFLGGYVAERLVGRGHDVRALVRGSSRVERLVALGVEVVRGDLAQPASLEQAVEGADVVLHAAATMTGAPASFQAGTVEGTRNLLQAAQAGGVKRFVHISSIGVLKMQAGADGLVSEDAPYEDNPALLGVYSRSKIEAERVALDWADRGRMDIVILRPGLLYGPRGKWSLPRMGYAAGSRLFLLVGMGGNRLPVCYVENCAQAAALAAEKPGLEGGVFNIVDDETFTQAEYLKRIKRDARPKLKIVRLPYLAWRALSVASGLGMKMLGRPNPLATSHMVACVRRLRYSNEKARGVLGWIPETGKEEALGATVRWVADTKPTSRRADLKALGRPAEGKAPLKACIVGCGVIAETHLDVLRRMKNASVAAVCDSNEEAANALAQQFGVPKAFVDLPTMLTEAKPDVLHILTPPQTHAEFARLAAMNGVHVYVEKPMALDAQEGRQIAECAKEHNVQVCVGHNHLFDPTVVKARRIIESGGLGDILWVESYYGFNLGENLASRYMLPGAESHWTFGMPGGLFQNLAAHPICLAQEALGAPTQIHAHARYGRVLAAAPSDELRILLETENASGLVTVSLAASPRQQYLNVFGTKMTLHVDLLNKWVIADGSMRGVPKPIARALANLRASRTMALGTASGMVKVLLRKWTPFDGMEVLVKEYYAALQRGESAPVDAAEGVLTMEIMDEAWRQVGEGRLRWPRETGGASEPAAAASGLKGGQ